MEIDKKRGERLRMIALREDITQMKLSELLDCNPVHLSKIVNGARNLTEDMARKVVSLFPEYRLQWLLGYDDYATDEEALVQAAQAEGDRAILGRAILQLAFHALGCSVCRGEDAEAAGEEAADADSFRVLDANRKEVARYSDRECEALCQEIADFAIFKIKRRFTTANIYAHIVEEADKRNADILADVFLKKA